MSSDLDLHGFTFYFEFSYITCVDVIEILVLASTLKLEEVPQLFVLLSQFINVRTNVSFSPDEIRDSVTRYKHYCMSLITCMCSYVFLYMILQIEISIPSYNS
jgi:hypothetical protein